MADLHLDVQPGDYWFVQMKGYPPWPAIICDEEMLPTTLLDKRPVSARRPDGSYREDFQEGGKNVRDRRYPVMFLGTNELYVSHPRPCKTEAKSANVGLNQRMAREYGSFAS